MNVHLRRSVLIALPLFALNGGVSAAESQSDLILRSLGEFVLNGLGPARTMEDIMREEREAAARARAVEAAREQAEERRAEPAAVATTTPPAGAASAQPQPQAQLQPVPAAEPVRLAKIEPSKVEPAKVFSVAPSQPDIIPPPPRARPQVDAKAAPALIALPPPEPLKSHIAATATVDQAIRLGGPSGLYGRRLAVD